MRCSGHNESIHRKEYVYNTKNTNNSKNINDGSDDDVITCRGHKRGISGEECGTKKSHINQTSW